MVIVILFNIRKNIKELDQIHENLKAKLNSEVCQKPEMSVHSVTETISSSNKKVSFASSLAEGKTDHEYEKEEHVVDHGKINKGKTIAPVNCYSELRIDLATDEGTGTNSTETISNIEEPSNSRSPETKIMLSSHSFSNVPSSTQSLTSTDKVRTEQHPIDESRSFSSSDEESVDSHDDRSPLNENVAKFKRYMDEKDSWLSSGDEAKEEENTNVVQLSAVRPSVSALPEVMNAIKYVTNLDFPSDPPEGVSSNPKLMSEEEEEEGEEKDSLNIYEAVHGKGHDGVSNDGSNTEGNSEIETEHNAMMGVESVQQTENEEDVHSAALGTKDNLKPIPGEQSQKLTVPSSFQFGIQRDKLDYVEPETDEEYFRKNTKDTQAPLSDKMSLGDQKDEAHILPNFFMPTRQLEQTMRAIRLGASAVIHSDKPVGIYSSLLEKVSKSEKQGLRSEFAKREVSYKAKNNPQISTAEVERIAKIFGAKIS